MMRRTLLFSTIAFAIAARAWGQPVVYDPDDFVDPGMHAGRLFIVRLVGGAARGLSDHDRPLGQDAAFAQFASSFYISTWQVTYKHSVVAVANGPAGVARCGCSPPLYFPTPPSSDATPAAPPPGSIDTVQFAFYLPAPGTTPLRYRFSMTRQGFDTDIHSLAGDVVERRAGRDLSLEAEGDIAVPIHGHAWIGTLYYSHTVRDGPTDRRSQEELTYTSRLPGWLIGPILARPIITLGRVTGRGSSGLNILNPALDTFWHHDATDVTFHLIWSPRTTRSGAEGWTTHHQIALLAERVVFLKLFKK